ncbi:phosphatase PAP2 family protein [Lentzea tibetensis]|uniref:Phosphatase PAP2 family protein n=1 Tax=Lentzea tibetensis TaxID=2591470 RepID=A0A563EGP9_9PSEU|nr:phosphatase PAP2 family protein [Lentzea tibetensis]TWP45232.1 phosphatase PAP2 family protein [Lentzea tibetensis]
MKRIARGATEVLAPWVWVLTLPFAVAAATEGLWQTLLWGLVVAMTASVIPMAVIVRGARQGKWDGHHVTNREGRLVPLLVAGASLTAGMVILVLGGAPHQMLALAGSMFASLLVSMAITFGAKWKISLHAAVAFAAVVTLALIYGPWLLLIALPAAFVAWSRVELGDHTTAQVLAGSVMGVVVGGGSFWALNQLLSGS